MNSKTVFLLLLLAGATPLPADDALYTVRFQPGRSFEFVADAGTIHQLSLYPLSEVGAKIMKRPGGRKIVAAGCEAAFLKIRAKQPASAAQELLRQISRQTGLQLKSVIDGGLQQIAPAAMVQAVSDIAVLTLILTPTANDVFLVTCAYEVDERPEGSIDGTPEAVTRMEKMVAAVRAMNGDSKATSLPARAVLKNLNPEEYFRGMMTGFSAMDAEGKRFDVAALILRKGSDYTVAFYRDDDGLLTMLGQPIELHGTRTPYLVKLPAEPSSSAGSSLPGSPLCLRVDKLEGSGGYDLLLEAARPVKKEF